MLELLIIAAGVFAAICLHDALEMHEAIKDTRACIRATDELLQKYGRK